jgi:hypothetical protein
LDDDSDRTASLRTPARLAQLKVQPKPAASPAAWLDQLAADAGSGHVRRLLDLRQLLQTQVGERNTTEVQASLKALAQAVRELDFSLLQPKGWLARATGKGKEAAAGFLGQHERVLRASEDLRDEVRALQKRQQVQHGAGDRALLEFDVELKAIEKIIDQGARWLQDMRNQLKAREAQGGDATAQQQMAEDAARCELLVARLKQLRGASSAAQQATEHCRSAARRRASLLENLQQALDSEWKTWLGALATLAQQAGAAGAAPAGVPAAEHAGRELQEGLKQARQDCVRLQTQEQELLDELAALQEPLQAAA